MSGFVLIDGCAIVFDPMFGQRNVTLLAPASLQGNGAATVDGRRMCVVGDEKRMQWPAQYVIPGYTPGSGMLSIETLDASQMAPCATSGSPLILQGRQFVARFTPTVPAVMSSPPNTPDPVAPSMGRGRFVPSQTYVRAG